MASSEQLLRKFGKNIRDQREKLELSQEDLAHKSGLDRTYISGIERGQRNPSLKNIHRLAEALSISIKDLL